MRNQRTQTNRSLMSVALLASTLVWAGCGSKGSTFSLLSDQANFQQNAATTNGKIDVLWVVDNSGSMETSQQNVAANFERFIEKFDAKGFDYQLAVITSDGYRKFFYPGEEWKAEFRDGVDTPTPKHSGFKIVKRDTPNVRDVFLTNILQGIYGHGDERVFQSIEASMTKQSNLDMGFPRPDAFLSVIIVSDEDDFSHDGKTSLDNQYQNAALHTVDRYVAFLDQLTGATPANRSTKYNVNSIAALDTACRDQLNYAAGGTQKVGKRYIELSDKTSGIKGSLCGDFGSTMAEISNKIIELTTQFYLNREPNQATLTVHIDGQAVPRLSSTDPQPWNGYVYHQDTNSITFHGSYVPGPGASIAVNFDPLSLK